MPFDVALLGFGNVGRALADLLLNKAADLQAGHDLAVRVVGISTGHHGCAVDPDGLDLGGALDTVRAGHSLDDLHRGEPLADTFQFIAACPAELFFEGTYTNPHDGEPALSYVRAALEKGAHVASANKGPVAFGYRELTGLAREKGVGFFFESTVMDGAPVLGVGREGLPVSRLHRIRGIFNSTTNYILTRMEQDALDFGAALREAQTIGIAEADPGLDLDGWDSAIKTVILANVLMGADLRPVDVQREGIRGMTVEAVRTAVEDRKRVRLVCEAVRAEDGEVQASVRPALVSQDDPLASVTGTSSIVDFEADTLHRLTLIEHDPGPDTTAYGLLVDMINLARGRHVEA